MQMKCKKALNLWDKNQGFKIIDGLEILYMIIFALENKETNTPEFKRLSLQFTPKWINHLEEEVEPNKLKARKVTVLMWDLDFFFVS